MVWPLQLDEVRLVVHIIDLNYSQPHHSVRETKLELYIWFLEAIMKLKLGKAYHMDGITEEMLIYGGETVVKWIGGYAK